MDLLISSPPPSPVIGQQPTLENGRWIVLSLTTASSLIFAASRPWRGHAKSASASVCASRVVRFSSVAGEADTRNARGAAGARSLILRVGEAAAPYATSRTRVVGRFAYQQYRENQLTLTALSDGRRAVLFGALGLIALLIAGTDRFFHSGGGTLAWLLLLGASLAAIWRIWLEANTY